MYIRKRNLLAVGAFVFPVALASCGGGGGGGLPPLSGNLNVASFTIPAGQTQTVTGDLVVTSSGPILIAGTLLIPPGVSTRFISSTSVSVTGSVAAAPALAAKSAQAVQPSRGRGAPTPSCGWNGPVATFSGNVKLPDGTSFDYCGFTTHFLSARINISGSIIAGAGLDSSTRGVNGGDGGSIEIGTAKAIATATAQFGATLFPGYSFAHAVKATISGSLAPGDGGYGYGDKNGVYAGATLSLTGTDGGNAGDCNIAADEIDLTGAQIIAGEGGKGGGAGYSNQPTHARDGIHAAEVGSALTATSGNGGRGSSIVLTSPTITSVTGTGGRGGSPGGIAASAGNGGPGGAGGLAQVLVGAPGVNGTGPNPQTGKPDLAVVDISSGGNGGISNSASMAGGRGGDLTIIKRGGGTAKSVVKEISLVNCGGGGGGYDGCQASPPVSGTKGGDAGLLNVLGAAYTAKIAFRGSYGGSGCPPGIGGKGGTDDAGNKIGPDGTSGSPCTNCPLATTFDSGTFFPVRPGDKYSYHLAFNGQSVNADVIVGVAKSVQGIPGTVNPFDLFIEGTKNSSDFWTSSSQPPTGVQIFGTDSYDGSGAVFQTVRFTPAELIPQGLAVGQSNSQSISEVDAYTGNPGTTVTYTLRTTLVGFADVTVAAGPYFGCAKVLTEQLTSTGAVQSSQTMFYAPGVGLVQSTATGGPTRELTAFVPGKSAHR